MAEGYNGKVLRVDLSRRSWAVEEPGYEFYRRYMGGSAWGAYYLLREVPPATDPLGEGNVLVLATSVVTGVPVSGFSRVNFTARSPLTGAIGDTQAGGWFPACLKAAGFDAVVVTGKAETPVYLWIHDGTCEIRDAAHLWGMDTGQTEDAICGELGNSRIRVSAIGPGGENLVSYACVLNERKFAAGRTGMGAVMGSKGLKAIAVYGEPGRLRFHDIDRLREVARKGAAALKHHPSLSAVAEMGSAMGVTWQQEVAGLPTRNFRSGVFEGAERLGGEYIRKTIHTGRRETCYACAVHCKQVVSAETPYRVDASYGAPEYETLAAMGSYLCIGDPVAVAKANELCNRYSLDTISTGACIAFAMECYEAGILSAADTDGLDLRFGNADAALAMIEKIARRQGLGDLLARGVAAAAKELGRGADRSALHVKSNPFPAHDPRTKASLALAYAICPFGADHVSSEHDPAIAPWAPEQVRERYRALGLYHTADPVTLDELKAQFFYYTQLLFSAYDTLEVCARAFGLYGLDCLTEVVRAATGWETSLWEILKAGERRWNMLRCFNAREGFDSRQDVLPERMFEPLSGGKTDGQRIDPVAFERAKKAYYEIAGWDAQTGLPTLAKLQELGLGWAAR